LSRFEPVALRTLVGENTLTMVEGNDKSFEAIKHVDPAGKEFWFASELMVALEYDRKDRFFELIDRAMEAAKNSGINPDDHFSTLGKMITIGKGGERLVLDYTLSRYACYLVAQNGDPRQKKQIALAQTYFALQTRRQEVNQERMEELERLSARQKLTQTEKEFASTLLDWQLLNQQAIWLFLVATQHET
jgi:DNA-damage-inducible protein D